MGKRKKKGVGGKGVARLHRVATLAGVVRLSVMMT